MSIKRLVAMVLVLLAALAIGTGNLLAVISYYAGEIERLAAWLF